MNRFHVFACPPPPPPLLPPPPSYVWTPLVSNQVADTAKLRGITTEEVVQEVMLKPMPKKAFIGWDELAGTCEFLMSDAAKNITGQAICVDGGWVAH